MKREEEKEIIGNIPLLLELIIFSNSGIFKEEEVYKKIYRNLMNSKAIRFADHILREFNYQDLRVYTFIRIVGMIDEFFIDSFYKNTDYLKSRKQQLENSDKLELMEIIQKLN